MKAIEGEKISIVTDEISQELDEIEKFLIENELNTIEIRVVKGKRIPFIDKQAWMNLLRTIEKNNLSVVAVSPGIFKGNFKDTEKIKDEIDEVLMETIEKTIELSCPNLICFGFMADQHDLIPTYIKEALYEAANICEDNGINLMLENEPGSFADTGERTNVLVERVNHRNLNVNWDPCNSNVFRNAEALSKAAQTLGTKIRHVHVKDGKAKVGSIFADYCLISEGHIRWREHLQTLKEMKYSGYFGIETHFPPVYENSAKLVNEFRSLMRGIKYWG
jgi:sugar phosphate isomerase/epimerase